MEGVCVCCEEAFDQFLRFSVNLLGFKWSKIAFEDNGK